MAISSIFLGLKLGIIVFTIHIMGLLSPYVIIGLMIAISTIFLFLSIKKIERQTSMLSEDLAGLRTAMLSQSLEPSRPRPVQVNRPEVMVKEDDADAATEDLQREIAEYERQIRELNDLKGEEPDISKELANMMAGIPMSGGWGMPMGITVIHSAEIPMETAEADKITEITAETPEEPTVPKADDEHSEAPSETHSISGEGRLIAEKYTLPQLKELCKKHGLAMKGNKNELANRLSAIPEVADSAKKNTLVMKLN